MENQDSLLGTLQTLFRWKKTIRNVCLVALVVAVGLSFLMDNFFKANTVFYPASSHLSSPEMMFGATGNQVEFYGSDRDLDRMTEIANSLEMIDFLIQKFKLFEHYHMDSTSLKGREKMREMVGGLYAANQNKYDAIEISVEDTDPAQAAAMANGARQKVGEIARRLSKESQKQIINTFEFNIKAKQADLAQLADSLRKLQNQYGIYETETTGEMLSTEFTQTATDITKYKARLEVLVGNPQIPLDTIEYIRANLRAAERQHQKLVGGELNRFAEGQPKVYVLKDLHFQARKQLSYDLERYFQLKSAYQSEMPMLHVIQQAEIPLVKSRPKRSLIVLGAVAAAFIFTLLAALIADNYRDVNWRKMMNEE